jgi:phosphonate transport system substrate-binding protein
MKPAIRSRLQRSVLPALTALAIAFGLIALSTGWLGWMARSPRTALTGSGYQPEYQSTPADPGANLPRVVVGIHPLHNPVRMFEVYGPLIDLLNERVSTVRFELETSRNYDEYDRKLYAGRFGLALPNPYEIVLALGHGYQVIAKADNDQQFRGLILVRRNSRITQPAELRGRDISFPAPSALAATMMPQQFLKDQGGLGIEDYRVRYVGSHESSMMNVVLGTTEAGCTWPPPWAAFQKRQPAEAAKLRLIWSTDPLPSIGWIARSDLDPKVVRAVRTILVGLREMPQGPGLLGPMGLPGFVSADNGTYRPVLDFLNRFNRTVRPIDTP